MNNIEEIIKDMQAQVVGLALSDEGRYDSTITLRADSAMRVIAALQSAPKWFDYPENRPKANKRYLVFKQGRLEPLIRKTDKMGFFKFRMEHLDSFMEIPEVR